MLRDFKLTPVELDIANEKIPNIQIGKQGDVEGRGLIVTVTDNGEEIDTAELTLELVWNHKKYGIIDVTSFNRIEDGRFEVHYPVSMLQPGSVLACIRVNYDGTVTNSYNFVISVHADPSDMPVEEVEDIRATITEILDEVNAARTDIASQQNEFEVSQSERQAAFETSQAEMQAIFESSQTDRQQEHDAAQTERQQAFDAAQIARQEQFLQIENIYLINQGTAKIPSDGWQALDNGYQYIAHGIDVDAIDYSNDPSVIATIKSQNLNTQDASVKIATWDASYNRPKIAVKSKTADAIDINYITIGKRGTNLYPDLTADNFVHLSKLSPDFENGNAIIKPHMYSSGVIELVPKDHLALDVSSNDKFRLIIDIDDNSELRVVLHIADTSGEFVQTNFDGWQYNKEYKGLYKDFIDNRKGWILEMPENAAKLRVGLMNRTYYKENVNLEIRDIKLFKMD